MEPPRRLDRARLMLLATAALCRGRPLFETVALALRGGVDVVQFREKELDDREFVARARALSSVVRDAGALFLLNDRVAAAREVPCDGVHVGQGDMPIAEARRILGPGAILGLSTHSLAEAAAGAAAGADYLGLGPAFATGTKETGHAPLGPAGAAAIARHVAIPVFAIGGISPATAPALAAAGLRRFAVSSAICGADDPEEAARRILAGT